MKSRNSKETPTSAPTSTGATSATPVGVEDATAQLEELHVQKGPEKQSGSQEAADWEPLSCKELAKLHLQLLLKEHKAELSDRWRLHGQDRLEGLMVVNRRRTKHGFHEWVLRLPGGRDQPFPRTSISKRDSVWVRVGHTRPSAVVRSKTEFELTLVMDKNKALILHNLVDVHQLHDDSTYERMCAALRQLPSLNSGPAGCLRATLFAEPAFPLEPPAAQPPPQLLDAEGKLELANTCLNASQREAVEFAIQQQRLAVIHGPPGTGKTTTAVEVILQHVERGQRVLVCAPSNVAVDNLLKQLCDAGLENMVRLGHPARIDEDLLDFWIDKYTRYLLENWEEQLGEDWHDKPGEKQLKRKVIEDAEVVLCTLATASQQGPLKLTKRGGAFDLVVIDECSQALEAECWLAVPRAGKLLLFGDPQQLQRMLRNKSTGKQGLGMSLMERQMKLHGDAVVRQLDTQYRMHELIQEWASECHYGGLLKAASAVIRHRLSQLEGVSDTEDTGPVLLLIDTAGCHLTELAADHTGSRRNVGEADIVATHAAALAGDGVRQEDMGVITPYAAQTALIRDALRHRKLDSVEVNTVDGFQGREKEAILLSLVRSNEGRNVGFLGDRRRINVAVTRARRQLCVVCDSDTVSVDKVLASLVDHLRQKGEVRSARAYKRHLSPAALRQFCPGPDTGLLQQGDKTSETTGGHRGTMVFSRSEVKRPPGV